ncbi:MAG: hypothetical protein ABIS36_25390 [Chryseolinea sp.]
MKLEKTLYQRSYLFFVAFFLFMLAGFWLTYFTRLLEQENYRMHMHGIAMILWCIMLISQAYLIRTKHTYLHRQIGKVSYVLVPFIAFTTIDVYKFRLSEFLKLDVRDYLFTASVLIALLTFLIFFGLAIYYRKTPAIHARYMVCTVFAMFTAVIDRIINFYFPSLLIYFPYVEGPVAQVVGLTLGDMLLAALCIWDWRSHKRLNVFPVALSIHLIYHFSVLNFYKFRFWRSFCIWFFEV